MAGIDNGTAQGGVHFQTKQFGSILRGGGPPVPQAGLVGDLYLDTIAWNLYTKRSPDAGGDVDPWGHYLFTVPVVYQNQLKWFSTSAPDDSVGVTGDYCLAWAGFGNYGLNPVSIYGPKSASGVWAENGNGPGTTVSGVGANFVLPIGVSNEGAPIAYSSSTQLVVIGIVDEYIQPTPVGVDVGTPILQIGIQSNPANAAITLNSLYTAEDEGAMNTLANIAALRANTVALGTVFIVGYNSVSITSKPDAGGGFFVVNSTDNTTPDDGGTVIVDAIGQRWCRQFSGPLNTAFFGALPGYNGAGGGYDSAPGFQAALNYCSANFLAELYTPAGRYFCGSMLTHTGSLQWRGGGPNASTGGTFTHGDGTTIFFNHTSTYAIKLAGTFAQSEFNMNISEIEFFGYGQSVLQHCIGCTASGHYFQSGGFRHVVFSNFTGCAIYTENIGNGTTDPYFQNMSIRDTTFWNMGACFGSDADPFGLLINNLTIDNCSVESMVNQTFPQHAFFDFRYVIELNVSNMIYEPANSCPSVFRIGSLMAMRLHGIHVEGGGTLPVNVFEIVPGTYGPLIGDGGDWLISMLYGANPSGKIIKFANGTQTCSIQLAGWPFPLLDPSLLVDFGGLTIGNKLVITTNGRTLTIRDTPPVYANLPTAGSQPAATEGEQGWITDCTTNTYGATAAGGGSHHVTVVYTLEGGAKWLVV